MNVHRLKLACFLFILFGMLYVLQSCTELNDPEFNAYYAQGSQLYKANCQNCHGEKGDGLESLIPALNDSIYLRKNRANIACFIRNGIKSNMVVNGKTYEFAMPANTKLQAVDIAKINTYILNSFGNNQGIYKIEEAEKDLKNCP